MLEQADVLFYFLAAFSTISAIGVITAENPIYCALYLVLSMLGVAGVFVQLDAVFLAAVQVIVYAGAVTVLFVMVIMLFDLKHEMPAFSKGMVSGALKLASAGVLLGVLVGATYMSAEMVFNPQTKVAENIDPVKGLANALFNKYVFGFEAIGFLLLVVAIGAVALSRIEGGTHARE